MILSHAGRYTAVCKYRPAGSAVGRCAGEQAAGDREHAVGTELPDDVFAVVVGRDAADALGEERTHRIHVKQRTVAAGASIAQFLPLRLRAAVVHDSKLAFVKGVLADARHSIAKD